METQTYGKPATELTSEQHNHILRLVQLTLQFSKPGKRRMGIVEWEVTNEELSKH